QDFKGIPIAIIALVTTVVECALRSFLNGTKGSQEFSEAVFATRWAFYHSKLQRLLKESPTWMKRYLDDLYQSILKQTNQEYLAIPEDDDFDYGALEASATGQDEDILGGASQELDEQEDEARG
ncbi:hypothetical protein BJ138DRAFT_1199123, partial [Hygrophoropsis aurantiaca]